LNVLQIFLLSNNSITGLDISENGLTDKDAEIICNITQTSPSLNELWLKKNKLTKTGVSQILDGLKDNNTLEFLDLSYLAEDCKDIVDDFRNSSDMITIDCKFGWV